MVFNRLSRVVALAFSNIPMKSHSTDHLDTGFVDAEIPIWRRMYCLSYHYIDILTIDNPARPSCVHRLLHFHTPNPLSLYHYSTHVSHQSNMKLTIFFPLAAFLSLTVADPLDDASPCLVCPLPVYDLTQKTDRLILF